MEEEEEAHEYGRGDTVDEEDSDEDLRGWDENGDPYLPFVGSWEPPLLVCAEGTSCTEEEADKIVESVDERNDDLIIEWCEMVNSNKRPLPAIPLRVLPNVTTYCVSGHDCYHLRYWTEITSETEPDHPYFRPCEMMQVFSLGLSRPLAHPVNIYGWFSVRDNWEPLRNYLFKCPRDNPAMISQKFYPNCT